MQYLMKFVSNTTVGHCCSDVLVVEHVFIHIERVGLEGCARDAFADLFLQIFGVSFEFSSKHVSTFKEYIFGFRATNSTIKFPFISSMK